MKEFGMTVYIIVSMNFYIDVGVTVYVNVGMIVCIDVCIDWCIGDYIYYRDLLYSFADLGISV